MNRSLSEERILHRATLRGGRSWSFIIRRGNALRITDLEGGANCAALFYNAAWPLERYNMADTLKAQHTAFLSAGRVCYSDMGRILVSITADSCGWHDTVCGLSDAALVESRWGAGRFQELRNDFHRNGRDLFLVELGKWGLGKRDLVANVNFFSKVSADEQGGLHFAAGHSRPGDYVDLRAEMDVLAVLASVQHPLDPAAAYAPRRLELVLWRADAPAGDDPCRLSRPENGRGFLNNAIWHCQEPS